MEGLLIPVSLTAFSRDAWDDATWREYCDNAVLAMQRGGEAAQLVVMYAPARGPTAGQRNLLVREYGDRLQVKMRRGVVIFSESAMARAVATVFITLLGLKIRMEKPSRYRDVLIELEKTLPFDVRAAIGGLEACIRAVGGDPKAL
jgi:hypothetical protein